ncbi:MAG: ribonuclease Y [Coriobacteriales bacterium]|jgi:ribonuclease Y|nr:ribonuclease Y [Coriobacteriales bacterium]
MGIEVIIVGLVALVVGVAIGFALQRTMLKNDTKNAWDNAGRIKDDAEKQADIIRREARAEAKDAAYQLKQAVEHEVDERRQELKASENRLLQREEILDKREESLEKRSATLDGREHQLSSLAGQVEKKEREVAENLDEASRRLREIAGMSTEQAREALLASVRNDVTREAAAIIREREQQTRNEADKKAREILSLAIQRVASDHTAELTVTSVSIPSDDIKGRIIGKEGRNIRTFEQITGINLIIDDTPETVIISSFDPVRREIGRITLENLIADGRIHPARIEEMFNKATKLVHREVQEAGDRAVFDIGIIDLHPELVKTLGALRYRTSFGQNVLQHSLEVAYLAGVMAAELGLDPTAPRRAGLLHDLGKALDHEVGGSHAVSGADLARRFGEKQEIVHAIEAHHGDIEPSSVLAVLVQAADAISGARPGARRESVETYIKRLEQLESIANSYTGVEKTYVMQAGREIRVMVEPQRIDDDQATIMARDIAHQIESEMQYPGQVKVLVIRESRAVSVAK